MKENGFLLFLVITGTVSAFSQNFNSLGIGINPPIGTLHVHSSQGVPSGFSPFGGFDSVPDPNVNDPDGNRMLYDYYTFFHMSNTNTGSSATDGFAISQCNGTVSIRQYEIASLIIQNNNSKIYMTPQGNVGIGGVVVGGPAFHVQGTARITGGLMIGNGFDCDNVGNLKIRRLKITATDWPDYVFGEDYHILTLNELERFISVQHHLPDIPSADGGGTGWCGFRRDEPIAIAQG